MFEGLRPTLRPSRGLTRRWRSQAFAGKYAKFVEVALRGGYETHALLLGAVGVLEALRVCYLRDFRQEQLERL